MNRWHIPEGLADEIRKRDKLCVYCRIKLREYPHTRGVPRDKATWEHINNNDLRSPINIVRCCGACNTSKGVKKLLTWFESEYCRKKNINEKTVAAVVKTWLRTYRKPLR
jgi:hypothetical protein